MKSVRRIVSDQQRIKVSDYINDFSNVSIDVSSDVYWHSAYSDMTIMNNVYDMLYEIFT